MEWYEVIAFIAMCAIIFGSGYAVGRHNGLDSKISEESWVELKKYYWDHPIGWRVQNKDDKEG